MKTGPAKGKPARRPGRAKTRRTTVGGSLKLADQLAGIAQTAAAGMTISTWKDWYRAFMATGRVDYLVRALHERLAADADPRSPFTVRSALVLAAMDVATDRKATDGETLRLMRKLAAIMKRYGKGPDDDWPEGEAPPDAVLEVGVRTLFRYVELTADVLREVGEEELAAAILAEPLALIMWLDAHEDAGDIPIPNDLINLDGVTSASYSPDFFCDDVEGRFQTIWTEHFPEGEKTEKPKDGMDESR